MTGERSTVRFYVLEDVARLVKIENGIAYVYRDGGWHESRSAWTKVTGWGGADSREITQAEAEALIGSGRADGARFVWTEEDFKSGGVYFHDGGGKRRDDLPRKPLDRSDGPRDGRGRRARRLRT